MKKGIMGLSLTMVIAIIIVVITITLIYIMNSEYGPKLLGGMKNIICMLPFLC